VDLAGNRWRIDLVPAVSILTLCGCWRPCRSIETWRLAVRWLGLPPGRCLESCMPFLCMQVALRSWLAVHLSTLG
jgi:hypothetical protein